jgi:SAM-dependent methyltransferase
MYEAASYFDRGYFKWQADRAAISARAVVPLLIDLVRPASVVDLGCGTGAWLQVFREHSVDDVVGIDGPHIDPAQLRIPEEQWLAADLASPPRLERRFDLALSLEAAHYAPEDAAPAVVGALASWAPVVYFSAAVPHQTGGPGLNRQWPAYWSELFESQGLRCYDLLRPELWEHPQVDWWYAQNGLLFAREGALGDGARAGSPLPLVHPELLAHVAEQAEAVPEPSGWLSRLRGS